MTSLKRELIVNELKDRFQNIGGDGYYGDFENKVWVWKTTAFQSDDTPGINIKDIAVLPLENESDSVDAIQDQLLVVDVDIVGECTSEKIRQYIQDVRKAIGEDVTLGGTSLNIIRNNGANEEILVNQESKKITGARIQLLIHYRTLAWKED